MDDLLQFCEGVVGFECFSNLVYVGDLVITKTVDSIIHKPTNAKEISNEEKKEREKKKKKKNTELGCVVDLLQCCEGVVGFECFSNLAYVGDLVITKTV